MIEHFRDQNIDTTKLDIKKYLIFLNMKSRSKSVYKSCIKEICKLAVRKVPYSSFVYKELEKIQPKDNIFIFGNIDDALHCFVVKERE